MKKFETLSQVMHELAEHMGSLQSFYRLNKKSIYTEGFKDFLEKAQCHWLYDIIETEVYSTLKEAGKLDTFYFSVDCKDNGDEARTVDLLLKDYRNKQLWSRHIEFTDLPTGKQSFVCGWDGEKMTTCLLQEN